MADCHAKPGVRALCLTVCEELGYFPDLLLDSLTADEGILLPDERLKIADLCIRFSQNPTAVLALVKYMCREYILDRNRYRTLCTTIAHRMNELQFPQTALLIWQDSQNCIWEELKDFEELLGKASQGQVTPQQDIDETERGLIELMAEAFATTGVAGLDVLKAHKNERVAGSRRLPIFRRFATKSAQRDTEFRTWLIKEAGEHPADRELKRIVEKLGQPKSQDNDNPDRLLCEYLLSGDQNTLNKLRFWPNTQVLEQVNLRLSDRLSASEVLAIIKLLKGYQTRYRETVIDVVLKHWSKLSLQNYDIAIDVLTAYSVPLKHRQTALDLLDHDMQGPHANAARRGLEKLLL